MIVLLAMRELRSLFAMPSTWFVLAVLQFIFAWFFLAGLDAFLEIQPQLARLADPPGVTLTIGAPLFYTAAFLLMMLVRCPHALMAEKRRNQDAGAAASPRLSKRHIVLGKFFGLWSFSADVTAIIPAMLVHLVTGHASGSRFDPVQLPRPVAAHRQLCRARTVCFRAHHLRCHRRHRRAGRAGRLSLADFAAKAPDSRWHQLSPLHRFQEFRCRIATQRRCRFLLAVHRILPSADHGTFAQSPCDQPSRAR